MKKKALKLHMRLIQHISDECNSQVWMWIGLSLEVAVSSIFQAQFSWIWPNSWERHDLRNPLSVGWPVESCILCTQIQRNKTRRIHEYATLILTSTNINRTSSQENKITFFSTLRCYKKNEDINVWVWVYVFLHLLSLTYCHTESRDTKRFRGLSDLRAFRQESCVESQLL